MKRLPVLLASLLGSFSGKAAEGVAALEPRLASSAGWSQWFFALLLVFGAMAAFFWLLRRIGGPAGLGSRHVRVVAGISLGVRERLVVVQTGGKQLVLGVSPGNIQSLCVLEGEDCVPSDASSPFPAKGGAAFAKQLNSILRRAEDGE